MKIVSASSAAAVLLGIGALLQPVTSYAQLPYCLPNCPTLHLQCIKGNQAACNTYYQTCMNCMELSADSGKPPLKHDMIANAAWVNSRQSTSTK